MCNSLHTRAQTSRVSLSPLFLLVSRFSPAVDSSFGTPLPLLYVGPPGGPHVVGPLLSDPARCGVAGIGMSGVVRWD